MVSEWTPDEVPEAGSLLPNDFYKVRVETLELKDSKGGKAMIKATFRVVEPRAFKNVPYYENYTIGSDDDPQVEDPKTWKETIGAKLFKLMLNKAQVPMEKRLAKQFRMAEGKELVVSISQKPDKNGKPQNNIASYFKVGERESGGQSAAPKPAPAGEERPTTGAQEYSDD